ncbi:MAG: alpha/beta fold hydrolase [Actinomycetota bacterium]|nr:alpha/beta fold hydrolase [Actinomycetota bacterium]
MRHPATIAPRAALAVALVVACLSVAVLGVAASPAGASNPYPVPYDFLLPAAVAGLQVDASPPGANIWSCKPSAAHPNPVVLVHGLGGNKNDNWQTYAPLLANNGYCVYALTYGVYPHDPLPLSQVGGREPMETSAHELAGFIDEVLAATGAGKVDIVGHSEGTQMPDYYAKFLGGAAKIDKYVSIAPIWHGTNLVGLASVDRAGTAAGFGPVINGVFAPSFGSGPEFLTGSAFYAELRSGGTPAVAGITYTNIVTKYDELVIPYSSGIQAGMTNIVLQDQCASDFTEHFEIASDPVAAADVLNALDPAHPRPVPCRLVLPFVGG